MTKLKIICTILLLAMLVNGNGSRAQTNLIDLTDGWAVQPNLIPTDVSLYSVFILPNGYGVTPVAAPRAIAVGENAAKQGVIYSFGLVFDGASTRTKWESHLVQTFPAPLRAVVYVSNNLWAVGDGLLVHDGREEAVPVKDYSLSTIQMLGDGSEGWAAGTMRGETQSQVLLLHYKDGAWQRESSVNGDGAIFSLHFGPDGGWAIGNDVWRYSGGTWTKESKPQPFGEVGLYDTLFGIRTVGSDEAWSVGSYIGTCGICTQHLYIVHRTAAGWQQAAPLVGKEVIANPSGQRHGDSYSSSSLQSVYFTDENAGWAVGYERFSGQPNIADYVQPLVLRYNNGQWSYAPTSNNQRGELHGLFMDDSNHGFAVGANGLVMSNGYGGQLALPPAINPTTRVGDPNDPLHITYFDETGHTLRGGFRDYWQTHGGLAQFGYPLTEEFAESKTYTYTVQYFERNRFEYHPENPANQQVQLGLLGRYITNGREAEPPFQPAPAMANPAAHYFGETSHNLSGAFLDYWQQHGGLAVYGYPISEAFAEVNPADGKTYTVQYFERNRFEFHPELAEPYRISLGLLGTQVLKQRGWLP